MKTKVPIEELVTNVLAELKRLNYSYGYLCKSDCFYKRVIAFADEKNEKYFSEKLGAKFLKEKCDCKINIYTEAMPVHLKYFIRGIRILGDYQLHGVILRRIVKKPKYIKPPQFEKVLSAYEIEWQRRDFSKRGLRTRRDRLFFFINFLDDKGIQDVLQITPGLLSDYIKINWLAD